MLSHQVQAADNSHDVHTEEHFEHESEGEGEQEGHESGHAEAHGVQRGEDSGHGGHAYTAETTDMIGRIALAFIIVILLVLPVGIYFENKKHHAHHG